MATSNTPLTIADLYQQYAGRAPDPEGLAYWTQDFGDTIDPREVGVFQTAVAQARAQGTEPAAQPAFNPAQIADTAGMGAQGIGLNFSGQSLVSNYYGDPDTSVAVNPNIDLSSAVGNNQTAGLGALPAAASGVTRDQVLAAYASNPLAELNPSEEAIQYWQSTGLGSFNSTVDAVRAADPGLAAAIDASRAVSADTGSTVGTTADTTGSGGALTQVAGTDLTADTGSIIDTDTTANTVTTGTAATTGATDSTSLNNTHVIALGDSTTFGYNAGNQLDTNMVSSAQTALGNNYTIDNFGVNSTTVGDLLAGVAGTSNNWQNTLASDAGVVVLNYGMNEAYRGEDPATFAANLTRAVNELKAAGKTVILQTPNIATGYDWAGNVSTYADVIRNVANATGSALDDKYAATSGMTNFFDVTTGDTIHPGSDAYAALGVNLANIISSLNNTTADSGATTAATGALDQVTAATAATTTQAPAATREQVLAAYQNNPLAETNPSEESINYWMSTGLGSFDQTVDAVRAESPEFATAIDNLRQPTTTAVSFDRDRLSQAERDAREEERLSRGPALDSERFTEYMTSKFGGLTPDDTALLEGFKYANDLGISNDDLRRGLGDELFNTYEQGLTNFATTNIESILADNQLTFDESQQVYNFARDLGFNSEDLARLTGQEQSLFDLIDTNYKTSRDQIIKTSLEAPTVESDADRVLTALALQDQFDFSDEDLSEATGLKLEDLRLSLDPVRNFQSDFSSLVGSADTTTAQLKDFLSQATGNEAISKMYGDSLGQVGSRLQELETKWSPYKTDALQAENLFNQLSGQRDALGGQYYRGVFGDLEKSAALLVNKGLDTLNDLGQKDKFNTIKADVVYTTVDGRPVRQLENGQFEVGQEYGDAGTMYVPIQENEVQATYGRKEYVQEGESGYDRFVPLTAEEQAALSADGTYQKKVGTVVIDKDTGNELTGLDGNLLYQRSGGHLTGKKHYLTAQFTPEGVPILTASEQKSGIYKFVSDVGPMIVSIAAMVPGPHQPFAMAANAALALEQKNYIGAVLSGLGAYGTYTGQQLASLTAAQKAGTVTDAAATASQIKDLTGTLSNIKLAQTAVAGVNALANDNLPGLINAGLSAYSQIGGDGGKLPSGVTTAVQAGNLAIAIDNGDVAGAMYALGDLTDSKDFKIAGAAKTLVDAFETGDPARIASAGLAFSRIVGSSDGSQTPVEDKRADADVTQQLADAGLEEDDQFARDAADMTEADIAAIVAEGGFGNVGAGELTAGPSGVTTKTVESMPEMSPRTGETAGEVRRVEPEPGFVVYERDMTYTKPDGTIGSYTITYDPEAREGMQLDYGSVSNIDYDNDLQLDQDGVNKILRTRPEIKAIDESFSSDDIDFDFDPFIGGDTIKKPVDTPPLDLTNISVPKIINASAVLPGLNISGSLKIVSITPDGLALAVDESGETSVVNNADGDLSVGDTVVADTISDGDSSGKDDGSVGGSPAAGTDQGGEDGGTSDGSLVVDADDANGTVTVIGGDGKTTVIDNPGNLTVGDIVAGTGDGSADAAGGGSGTGDGQGGGDGTGDGDGTGAGTGTEVGTGTGAGTGTGTSTGSGDGAGDGSGTGDGTGDGDGDGAGDGDGDGAGDGDGDGDGDETVKPATTPKVTPLRMTPTQVAQILNVPVSSPIVQDVIEALYGTMEYLDIGAEFETSKRKARPAATQKQREQTKMAQGGYLDDLLAENTSVDELLNLLR